MPTTTIDSPARCRAELERRIAEVVAVPAAVLEPVICALFARGHLLLEGIPGIGKTLLARTLAQCIAGDCKRIQFTNDLMPSDIVGSSVWRPDAEQFLFVRGPLFANVVLADEINRTSPRTLSCLLEAMESGHVSVDGHTMELGQPFLVLATRNPIEFHGTFPVPEAALDRFLVRVELGYPEPHRELQLYTGRDAEQSLAALRPVLDLPRLRELQDRVDRIEVAVPVAEYAYRVVAATRTAPGTLLGASPRAALSWLRAARARAMLHDRDYVLPDDLKTLALPVLAHRILLQGGEPSQNLLQQILARTEVPL